MSRSDQVEERERLVGLWRDHLRSRSALHPVAVEEAEGRLRTEIAALRSAGLDEDEAFLVGVRRLAGVDAAAREFARDSVDRSVGSRPVDPRRDAFAGRRDAWREALVACGLAGLAALAIKAPAPWVGIDDAPVFHARNLSLFVLPWLTIYVAWKRGIDATTRMWLALAFLAAAAAANFLPVEAGDSPGALTAIHLPVALWLAVGIAHAGGRWSQVAARMDFVRFSGELFVYYVLIALGGVVVMGFTHAMFQSIGLDAEPFFERWLLPCGAAGAVVIAAWLVETRQSVTGSIASMLTRLFVPLFTVLLLVFLATMTWAGRGPAFHRDLLIAFDLLLAVVVGLLLFSIAGRD